MAGQRRLETAAERRPVQRGNDDLRRVLDLVQQVRQVGLHGWLAELGNVGAGNERSAGAKDDDGLRSIILGRAHRLLQTLSHRLGQRIDRWVVDGDHADGIDDLVIYR